MHGHSSIQSIEISQEQAWTLAWLDFAGSVDRKGRQHTSYRKSSRFRENPCSFPLIPMYIIILCSL